MSLDQLLSRNHSEIGVDGFLINPTLHRPFVVRSGDLQFSCVMHADVSAKLPDGFFPRVGNHLSTTKEGRWEIELDDLKGNGHVVMTELVKVRNLKNGLDFVVLKPVVIRDNRPAIPGFVGQLIGVLGAGR